MTLKDVLDVNKSIYVKMLQDEIGKDRKKTLPHTYIKCAKCGSTNTLHKIEKDVYLCDKCYKKND